jgi:hypothetical protein
LTRVNGARDGPTVAAESASRDARLEPAHWLRGRRIELSRTAFV